VSPTAFQRLVTKMYNLAMAGNVQAGMFLITQLAGKAPEPLTPVQMDAAARVTRQAPMDIETIAAGLQRVYEDYQSGRVNETEATTMKMMLSTLLECRKVEDIARKLETIEDLLQRGKHA
jgi:predicted S18 family serine protease